MPITYIVVHYTANNGDTAAGNASYFANNRNLSASAHYFVDEYDTVYQSVNDSDTAWHCGGGLQGSGGHEYYQKCFNSNSIGVELCSRKNGNTYYFKPETVKNAAALVRELMERYKIPAGHVIRHYDVTGKICPAPFVENQTEWEAFQQMLNQPKELMSAAEAIAVLEKAGIICEPEKWYAGTWTDDDFKWLIRKMGEWVKERL